MKHRLGTATSRGKARVDKERTGCSLRQGSQGSESEGRGRKQKMSKGLKCSLWLFSHLCSPGNSGSRVAPYWDAQYLLEQHPLSICRAWGGGLERNPAKPAKKMRHALGSQGHTALEQSWSSPGRATSRCWPVFGDTGWSLIVLGKLDAPLLPTAAVMGWCLAAPWHAKS